MNPKTHWKMRDGNVIPIREMDDSHLLNTIRMLSKPHGIGVCDPEGIDFEVLDHPSFDALCDEAARRKLDY